MTNVLLIGMGATALSALESLTEQFHVLGVFRPVDLPMHAVDPVVAYAQKFAIPIFSDMSRAALTNTVADLKPDCVVVSSYHRILPPSLLAQSAFINVHYAPLPQYRGRATINWALINGDSHVAITIHTLIADLDAGNVLFQQRLPIQPSDTVATLYDKLNALQRAHLAQTVSQYFHGYQGQPQDPAQATYGCTRTPADGEVDWTASTQAIDGLIRALVAPFPGAYTYFEGQRLLLWKAAPAPEPPTYAGRVPGRVVGISRTAGWVDVLTGDGVLRVWEVQQDHGPRVMAAQVIRSVRTTLGLSTTELLDRIHTLEQHMTRLLAKLEGQNTDAK